MNNIEVIIFEELCNMSTLSSFTKLASEDMTYSSLMRNIGKNHSQNVLKQFREIYKDAFDNALFNDESDPEKVALDKAIHFISKHDINLDKTANMIALIKTADKLGNPSDVGRYLADLIKFILRKIDAGSRNKSLNNLRRKIYNLNENEIASKKMPSGASVGQSLVIIKHLLFGKDPRYVRQVLNNISKNL